MNNLNIVLKILKENKPKQLILNGNDLKGGFESLVDCAI